MKDLDLYHIELEQPIVGNKLLCAHKYGIYILEKGPGVWKGLACTHAGTGNVNIYDGIADARGFFPEGQGRLLYKASPSVSGVWMQIEAGYNHGLTMIINGDISPIAPFLSITWLPAELQERNVAKEAENAKPKRK